MSSDPTGHLEEPRHCGFGRRFYAARAGVKQGLRRLAEPDWPSLVREMRRPGVNLTVLWEEYREAHPNGYGYSRFCDLYREFERRLTPVMRQHHPAGDKVFFDYSGKRIAIVDPATGVVRQAEIFVAVLGASSLTYAEVTWTQTLPDWIGAHVRLFRFLGGVPRLVVPDNLKSAVHNASFYDPEINRSYGMMADHYGVGKVFPDPAMTLAAVDRLVHHATIFEMNVESYRRRVALDRKRGPGRPPTRATAKTAP